VRRDFEDFRDLGDQAALGPANAVDMLPEALRIITRLLTHEEETTG
jgi:hypothetical protein